MNVSDMTATQKFIEDAIKGGWKQEDIERCTIHFVHENANDGKKNCFVIDNSYTDTATGERHNIAKHYSIGDILLDPLAWQAVGNTRGWRNDRGRMVDPLPNRFGSVPEPSIHDRWHDFIDHLIDGKTPEEALAAIN